MCTVKAFSHIPYLLLITVALILACQVKNLTNNETYYVPTLACEINVCTILSFNELATRWTYTYEKQFVMCLR